MTVLNVDRAELHKAWDEIADSGFYTEGKYTRLFEEAVEDWCGMHAVAVNSCGSGLFALYRQFSSGRALVPTNTFFATGAMAREAGHGVKLVDCGAGDFAMGLDEMCQAITPEITMVVLTHVGGWLAKDYELIAAYCALKEFRNYGKWASTTGEIRYNRGRASGFNLRMDEWTAAVAYLQTKRLDDIRQARADAAARLCRVVPAYPGVPWEDNCWYKYPVEASFPAKKTTGKIYQLADQLQVALSVGGYFPNAEKLARAHICLPLDEGMYQSMSLEQIMDYLTKG
jgi:dTDP-4-amino-4,6-dideoxygalactose transaminase